MMGIARGVSAIANAVASGAVSAVDIARDHLERAEQSQDRINAFTLIQHDGAMAAAVAVDARIAAGDDTGPLAGVPIAVKDLIDHAGYPNTAGSSYPTAIPDVSAPVIQRLEAAGAVIIGRTGLHEYAFGFSSENHWFGPVRNPWNTELSPGGSSGGSGAAVAAGVVAAAIGTDTGGSVRVPAALCGVVGLKVTHGRVPLTGVFPLAASLDTVGPLARNSNDAALIYSVIAGHDATDPWAAPQQITTPQALSTLAGIKVGIPHPWVDFPLTATVAASFASARSALEVAGASVIDLDIPALTPGPEIEHIAYPEVALVHDERWHSNPALYGPDVSKRLGEVFDIDPVVYVAAQEWQARIRHTAEQALTDCDFLLTPTVAASVKPIGQEEIEVAGKQVSYRPQLSRYSALVNHMGLPALALPLDMDGVPPPSIQLIGRRWEEHRLLEMGSLLEQVGISRYRRPSGAG